MAALRARFDAQSRKAQAYYTVMHEIRRRCRQRGSGQQLDGVAAGGF
jgi:hypothetical protein